jgi:hypothetical protein
VEICALKPFRSASALTFIFFVQSKSPAATTVEDRIIANMTKSESVIFCVFIKISWLIQAVTDIYENEAHLERGTCGMFAISEPPMACRMNL